VLGNLDPLKSGLTEVAGGSGLSSFWRAFFASKLGDVVKKKAMEEPDSWWGKMGRNSLGDGAECAANELMDRGNRPLWAWVRDILKCAPKAISNSTVDQVSDMMQ
jgi:hypothetical protein